MSNILNNDFSKEIFETTYQFENETVEGMFKRVADKMSSIEDKETWQEVFYNIISSLQLIPGGRILSNAGTAINGTTMINCFVDGFIGPDQDSMSSIMDTLKRQAMILKSEGGYGFCADVMRPRGTFVLGIGNNTPGSIEMLEMWDKQSDTITKGSGEISKHKYAKKKIRKGAQMVTQSVWHPDIEEFITAKQTPGRLTKFNMSVLITDEFMHAVKNHLPWNLEFPDIHSESKYLSAGADVYTLDDGKFPAEPLFSVKQIYKKEWTGNLKEWKKKDLPTHIYKTFEDANELWDLIMESTYNRNEPGVLFHDTINRLNNLHYTEYISATNPCGEQLLPIGGVCLLGSMNLTQFIDENGFNFEKFKPAVETAVRMLDNVNDITYVPLENQKENLHDKRRIGLGVVGYGSALMMLKLRYGSKEALAFTNDLMDKMKNWAYQASANLANEKTPFPLYDEKEYLGGEFVKQLWPETLKVIKKYGIRNSHLLSIQPTGNTSSLANIISSGLEPLFLFEYIRTFIIPQKPRGLELPKNINYSGRTYDWTFDPPSPWEWIREGDDNLLRTEYNGIIYKLDQNRGITKESLVQDFAVKHLKDINEWNPDADWAVDTSKLSIDDHINTMKVFSKHIDSAMSKTINLPEDIPYEDFKNIYTKLHESGSIKGGTTYRAGTMATVLASVDDKVNNSERSDEITTSHAPKRLIGLSCDIIRFQNQGEKWIGFIGLLKDRPYELFTGKYDAFQVPNYVENGVIHRHKNGNGSRYDLIYNDKDGFKVTMEGLNRCFEPEFHNLSKMISAVMRHGMPLEHLLGLVKSLTLTLDSAEFGTWQAGVVRMIKKYIKSGSLPKDTVCPQCNDENGLIYADGCVKCKSCNYSVCN